MKQINNMKQNRIKITKKENGKQEIMKRIKIKQNKNHISKRKTKET